MIRWGDAKKSLAKYEGLAGKCVASDLFVTEVLQYLLLHGTYGNERKFIFHAQNGWITLPYELDTPLKMKIDGEIGSVWNRWFEYHSGNMDNDCCLAQDSLFTEPNRYATVYDVPSCGSYLGVTAVCEEDCDAHIIVKGLDPTGREIITVHKGEKIVGEYLNLKKCVLTRSTVIFGKITEVAKEQTNGPVTLLAVSQDGLRRQFLSEYGPFEKSPSYQRARILKRPCPPMCAVSILGRIRLKEHYADDDLIPFDNLYLLNVAGQTVNTMRNDEVDTALKRDTYVKGLIEIEDNYKKVTNGQPLEFFKGLSSGLAMNARRAGRRLRRLSFRGLTRR